MLCHRRVGSGNGNHGNFRVIDIRDPEIAFFDNMGQQKLVRPILSVYGTWVVLIQSKINSAYNIGSNIPNTGQYRTFSFLAFHSSSIPGLLLSVGQ